MIEQGLPEAGWSVAEVREAIGAPELPIPKSLQLPEIEEDRVTDIEALLEYVIRPKVVANGSRFFLVRTEDLSEAGVAFEELLERGLVERDTLAVLPTRLQSRFQGFWLSEDRWLALGRPILLYRRDQRQPEKSLEEMLGSKPPRITTARSASPYVLDFTQWRA